MQYKVTHTTVYEYEEAASLCHNLAMLKPRHTPTQICKTVNVLISPEPDVVNEYEDFFGNRVFYFAIQQEHKQLNVTVTSVVENTATSSGISYPDIGWEEAVQQLKEPNPVNADLKQFVSDTHMTVTDSQTKQFASQSFKPGKGLVAACKDLAEKICKEFSYSPGFSTIATPVKIIMQKKKGVCQDFAHLAIACVRSMGLAARYVSGYLETLPPEGETKLVGADASHAWFSVFVPGAGWVDFDPTNNLMPSSQHITIGWGRDYADVTPLKGVILSGGNHKLSVAVDVQRV
ncbi:MAG: transglutaminase family protein [Chitinophagaceae bacterium]|nr:transglutaminase family protein [Chitinophagaceae bacterium]MCW5929078.1 transglutaminase family protein [Chitinophagaceae bacterium]